MALTNINSATYSDRTGSDASNPYYIPTASVENYANNKENYYSCDYLKWLGIYNLIPECQAVIDAKAKWIMGKGYKSKDGKEKFLKKIKGMGKDTFNSILYNQVRVSMITGDSFAEIIRNKRAELVNLKPLSPDGMHIITNNLGMIIRYEQWNGAGQIVNVFAPEEIFHLCWNRAGAETHGHSIMEKLETIILCKNQLQNDLGIMFHRYVKPISIIPVDEDDTTKIATFKAKYDAAFKYTENMIVPKGTVDVENIKNLSIPQYSTLDPMPFLMWLGKYFIMAEGVPEIVLGYGGETTEATSKIIYMAWQQTVEWGQLWLEDQTLAQLDVEIEFEFPASVDQMLAADKSKDGNNWGKPSDTQVTAKGAQVTKP